MNIEIGHVADIHIGMENYGRLDPQTGLHTRLLDFLHALDQFVDYAIAHLDAVVIAGDLFKSRDPNPTQQDLLARRLLRLSDAGLPTVIVPGNHDVPAAEGKAIAVQLFDTLRVPNLYVLRKPDLLTLQTPHGLLQVAGIPWFPRSRLLKREEARGEPIEALHRRMGEWVAQLIDDLAQRLQPRIPSMLVTHFTVDGAKVGSERSIMLGDDVVLPRSVVARPEFDYVALGHIHRHQVLNEHPPVVYSGSLERIDFGEVAEQKGFVHVSLGEGRARYRFVPIAARPFVELHVQVHSDDPTAEALQTIEARDLTDAVVKLVLELPEEDAPRLRADRLLSAMRAKAFYVAGVERRYTRRINRSRDPEVTERSEPLEALQRYLRQHEALADVQEALLQRAQDLMERLREKESVK